jgi:hypothetical protein
VLKTAGGLLTAYILMKLGVEVFQYMSREPVLVIDDTYSVEGYRYWNISFEEYVSVSYDYIVRSGNNIRLLILGDEEFTHYENNERYRSYLSTEASQSKRGEVELESGDYVIVLDKVNPVVGEDTDASVEFDLEAEPGVI